MNKQKRKWCVVCGMPVDLRKGYRLSEEWMRWNMPNVVNKEYWYIHKECNQKMMEVAK